MSGKHALVIGNTEYTDSGLAQLTAPGKDAEDLAKVLKSSDYGGFDSVTTLINTDAASAKEAIEEFFNEKTKDDLLLLYFSGHGVKDELGRLYLAVRNTNRAKLRSTAVESDFVRDAMAQSRSKRQVLILDCCNSGAFAQGTKAETGGSVGTASAFASGYGQVILTASDSTQYAWEGNKVLGGETDNSLFTHYLVQGLKGEADRDGDGQITVDELYDYAYDKVRIATPKQTPSKFSNKQQGEIVLREGINIKDIPTVPLPKDLIESMESPYSYVREAAVQQLIRLVNGKNLGLARSARDALENIAENDDSRTISRAALQALEAITQADQAAQQRAEAEKLAFEEKSRADQVERERKAKEKEEADRIATQKAEEERAAKAKAEKEQKEKEAAAKKAEADRLAAQKAEEERAAKVKAEKEQKEKEAAAQKAETDRKAKEEADRLAAQKAEAERLAKQKAEEEHLAAQKAEEERLAQLKTEADRKAKEEADRLAMQKAEAERLAQQRAEEERLAKAKMEKEETERLAAHKAEAERLAKQKVEEERAAKAKAEKERKGKEKADHKELSVTPAVFADIKSKQGQKDSKSRRNIYVIVAVVVVAAFAVVYVNFSQSKNSIPSTSTTQPINVLSTPTPMNIIETVSETPTSQNFDQVFSDDFSVLSEKWVYVSNTVNGDVEVNSGKLNLIAHGDEAFYSIRTALSIGPDVSIKVETLHTNGAFAAVFCRNLGNAFYLFILSFSDLDAGISLHNFNGDWSHLSFNSFEKANTYSINAVCSGSVLTLFINNAMIVQVDDTTLKSPGNVGLYVESEYPSGSVVQFDNFYVETR